MYENDKEQYQLRSDFLNMVNIQKLPRDQPVFFKETNNC